MEAEIKENFADVKVRLIEGGGGIFDVTLEETVIFSKNRADCGSRFPDDGEISQLVRARLKA